MKQLTVINVNGGERAWGTWLGVAPIITRGMDQFINKDSYKGDGHFLVLIHPGSMLGDGEIEKLGIHEQLWSGLGEEIRERVWWLFYSGAGYSRLTSRCSHIHYLRYLVENRDVLPAEEVLCFRRLLARLKADHVGTISTIWSELYPESNRKAVTFLTILAAEAHVPHFENVIRGLLENPNALEEAHREYSSRAKDQEHGSLMSFEQWISALSAHQYADIKRSLEEVLGSEPD